MLLDKGLKEFQYGSCQGCLLPTNHSWYETTLDLWFHACNEECAKVYTLIMIDLVRVKEIVK